MSLSFCADVSPANWIANSTEPWTRLIGFGPSVFPSYARLRYIPDPTYKGQSENDVVVDPKAASDADLFATLLQELAAHTRTPDDCYFCVWEGFADTGRTIIMAPGRMPPVVYQEPNLAPAPAPSPDAHPAAMPSQAAPPRGPQVVLPNRQYFLFQGRIADGYDQDTDLYVGQALLTETVPPAFAWPADHAWCVASDVDPHWAGIGASDTTIDALLANPKLDIVSADPSTPQPEYQ